RCATRVLDIVKTDLGGVYMTTFYIWAYLLEWAMGAYLAQFIGGYAKTFQSLENVLYPFFLILEFHILSFSMIIYVCMLFITLGESSCDWEASIAPTPNCMLMIN
ncbi:hypothetical protein ACJX0J_026122, partial [Zea mays]